MTSSAKKIQEKNPFRKPNKNIQINMSTLSTAQKQMCLKLLASSNVNFEQGIEKNCFEAELKIDPSKLTSQFTVQKQKEPEPNVSPIKNRQPLASKKSANKQKQNQSRTSNLKLNQKQNAKQQTVSKQTSNTIYTSSKKSLSKTIKLNSLTELQILYPFVQLYVYPKKMPFHGLIELIEEIYDLYWNVEINKQKPKQKTMQKEFSFDNKSSTFHDHSTKQQKNTQTRHKQIYQQQQVTSEQTKQQDKKTFCSWVFQHFILPQKQKMKIEQLLVNFVESLNHFSYKNLGIQMFYNFLAGTYNLETLNYYLVIRALLQQIEGEKIIEKVSSYGSKAGVLYKMKLNPYTKTIEEEKVMEFLQICCQSSNNQSKQQEIINKVFQEMTEQMFFDQKRKKNYISYFEMVEFLLREFLKVETVNTTNLQLSYTNEPSSMNDFMFQEQLNGLMGQNNHHLDEDLQLTFEVNQQEQEQRESSQQYYIQQSSEGQLNDYLPNYYSRELEIEPVRENPQQNNFQNLFHEELLKKYELVKRSFSGIDCQDTQNLQSRKILETLFESVVRGDKKRWTELMANKKINPLRESQELHFIEKLQIEFNRIKNSNIVSNQFIRKILTAPYLREAIVSQAGISFNHP